MGFSVYMIDQAPSNKMPQPTSATLQETYYVGLRQCSILSPQILGLVSLQTDVRGSSASSEVAVAAPEPSCLSLTEIHKTGRESSSAMR